MSSFNELPPDEQAEILHLMTVDDFRYTITVCCLGAATVPVLFLWVLFSTPKVRRQPVFWIQLVALVMALAAAALEVAAYYIDILYQHHHMMRYSQLLAAKEVLKWYVPPLTDTALIFRLMAFYPSQLKSRRKRLIIVAFPVLVKIPRLTAITINLVYAVKDWLGPRRGWPQGLKFQAIECVLQVLDNTYVSTMILVRVYRKFHAKNLYADTRSVFTVRASRLLFEAFTMSFAPAVLIQIALALSMVIPLARDQLERYSDLQNFFFTTNIFVSLIFSLLATSWSSICNSSAAQRITAQSHRKLRYDGSRALSTLSTGKSHWDSTGGQSSGQSSECKRATRELRLRATSDTHGGSESDESRTQAGETHVKDGTRKPSVFASLFRRTRSTAMHVDSESDWEGAGRSTLLVRNGIESPYKGEDRTLLHSLVHDGDLERYANGFYFVDGNAQANAEQDDSRAQCNVTLHPPLVVGHVHGSDVSDKTAAGPPPSPGTNFNGSPLLDFEDLCRDRAPDAEKKTTPSPHPGGTTA